MNYEYLKTFYIVCKHHNLSRAAEELFTSQPAVSRVISTLEAELGFKLFNRTRSGVILTREGQNFYDEVVSPLKRLEKIESDINNEQLFEGTIHIGATVTSLHCFLFNYLDILKSHFPNLHFKIFTGSTYRILSLLKESNIDFGFVTTPFDYDDALTVKNIVKINTILVAGNKYKEELNKLVSIKELEDYPFILLSNDMQFREHINAFLNDNKIKVVPEIEADSSDIIMPLVEHNYGLSFVPEEMALESINKNNSFKIKLKEDVPSRHISFIVNKKSTGSNVISQVENFILSGVKE